MRGLYSRLARGTCVAHTGLHLPQRRQSLIAVGDRADVGLLHDQRLVAHQAEARRVGVGQVGVRHAVGLRVAQQLALVEAAFGVDARL